MPSTYSWLHFHFIFATKSRVPTIHHAWREEMHKYIVGTAKGLSADPIAVGGTDDHVHLFARLRPTHSISDFMRELKKASSTIGKSKDGRFAWQEGYAVFSVGRTEADMIAKYVRGQEEHHRTRTSAEELEQLLREHGIEYDPRYFE